MIVFGIVVIVYLYDFRNYWVRPDFFFSNFCDDFLSFGFLLGVVIENRTAILWAYVVTLLVKLCRVVQRKENFQYFAIANAICIEGYLYYLGVAGSTGAYFFISWIGFFAPSIARNSFFYTLNGVKR